MTSTEEVRGVIGAYLPRGWHIETHQYPDRYALRLMLWYDVEAEAIELRVSPARTFGDLIHDALFGTFQRWLGAQPLADRYWAE